MRLTEQLTIVAWPASTITNSENRVGLLVSGERLHCRIVKDRIRLWKQGVRDLVMELCCALHNFRVRLTPWQPMI